MKKYFFIVTFLSLIFGIFNFVSAKDTEVDFFYSKDCSHCAAEEVFLEELVSEYPDLKVNWYEVIYNTENQDILREFYNRYNVPQNQQGFVPVTFISEKYFVGFNEQTKTGIESYLKDGLIVDASDTEQKIKVPFLGSIDVSKMSLPMLTVVFGALDGFNPCAMWILLFLIALLINTRSRKRMWLIGGIFLLVSGVFYYLILAAWFNLFLVVSYVNLTRILIGALAIGLGIWQIRSFIKFRPNVCKVTDGEASFQDKLKEKLKTQAEKVVFSPFTLAVLGGTIILALGVNLVEFFCSAGLPAIYTRILALSGVSSASHYLYLLLYTAIFMLDDIIVFSLAVFTLSRFGFTEKYNRWSTLIGGLLILILGLLLIFRPDLLMFG